MTVLSDINENKVFNDTITAFEVVDTSLNDRGDTYTVECKATTSSGEHNVTVYYELSSSSYYWNYSQAIAQ